MNSTERPVSTAAIARCVLPTPRAEDEDVFGLSDEAARGELADEPLIDETLKFEVKVLEGLHARRSRAHSSRRKLRRLAQNLRHSAAHYNMWRIPEGGPCTRRPRHAQFVSARFR
jgi:hypothetical protein